MDIRWLCDKDYEPFIDLLNSAFSKAENRHRDFAYELPKLKYRDNEHMKKHLGIFDGHKIISVIGVYPLSVRVGKKDLLFVTTGNVATHWAYTGKGYMNELMNRAILTAKKMGADCTRLSGSVNRYGRFGYQKVGSKYNFTLPLKNKIEPSRKIDFVYITKEDISYLEFAQNLYEKGDFWVKRESKNNFLDMFYALNFWKSQGFIALYDNTPIGYVCLSDDKKTINEINSVDLSSYYDILANVQNKLLTDINFSLYPHEREKLLWANEHCSFINIANPSLFNIFNIEKMADAFIKLKASSFDIMDKQLVIDIIGYGKIRLFYADGSGGAEKTTQQADLSLTREDAIEFLFGNKIVDNYSDFNNLPLTFSSQDCI